MNSKLIEPVSELEIEHALFSMNPTKAQGEDGLTPLFFQKYWGIPRVDICKAIVSFFKGGIMLKNFNHTIISLILKVK